MEIKNVVKMKLSSSEIPNTEYLINDEKRNNKFTINIKYYDTTTTPTTDINQMFIIIIPNGNWYSEDIKKYINDIFNTIEITTKSIGIDENYSTKSIGIDKNYNNNDNETIYSYSKHLYFDINNMNGRASFRFKTENEIIKYNSNYNSSYHDDKTYYINYTLSETIDDANILNDSKDFTELTELTKLSYNFIEKKIDDNFDDECFFQNILGFTCKPSPNDNYIDYQIGLDISSGFTYNYGSILYEGYIESKVVYSENMHKYYFIYINDFNNSIKEQVISCLNDSYIGDNIIARVQLNNKMFGLNINNNNDNVFKTRNYFRKINVKKLHIKILNKYGKVVNLNNCNVSLSLELTQKYSSCN